MRAMEQLTEKPAEAVATPAVAEEAAEPGGDTAQEERPAEGQEQAPVLIADASGQFSFF